jgi:hypothetical protein
MRLLFLPLILAALPAAAAPTKAQAPVQPADRIAKPLDETCNNPMRYHAETPETAKSRKLGDLPPGDLLLSVYNQVEGCSEPVIVRYGDGRLPAAQPPADPSRPPRAQVWR